MSFRWLFGFGEEVKKEEIVEEKPHINPILRELRKKKLPIIEESLSESIKRGVKLKSVNDRILNDLKHEELSPMERLNNEIRKGIKLRSRSYDGVKKDNVLREKYPFESSSLPDKSILDSIEIDEFIKSVQSRREIMKMSMCENYEEWD